MKPEDEIVLEPDGSLSLTRGGRETKPPIKYQDMEWKTAEEEGSVAVAVVLIISYCLLLY